MKTDAILKLLLLVLLTVVAVAALAYAQNKVSNASEGEIHSAVIVSPDDDIQPEPAKLGAIDYDKASSGAVKMDNEGSELSLVKPTSSKIGVTGPDSK